MSQLHQPNHGDRHSSSGLVASDSVEEFRDTWEHADDDVHVAVYRDSMTGTEMNNAITLIPVKMVVQRQWISRDIEKSGGVGFSFAGAWTSTERCPTHFLTA